MSIIRDNYKFGKVGEFLKESIKKNSKVSIVSAYFTIHAYYALKEELENIQELRFLFGEPNFIKSINIEEVTPKAFKIEEDQFIPIERKMSQKLISKECAEWIKTKVEIRSMVKPNFLHGKIYHITHENGRELAIVGSSNFTHNGLGFGKSKNIELNVIIDSDRDRNNLKEWFNDIWENNTGIVQDVKEEVLNYLQQMYKENDPEFIYLKTLYHIFEEYLNEQQNEDLLDTKIGFYNSEVWNKLYDFQKDGVKGAINKILKHNGCIIADSVGLGKTFEALAIIKYFELLNYRVLVICPKKLSRNWTIYQASQSHTLNPFQKDRFNYTVLYHTDMGREKGSSDANGIDLKHFNWGAYDLVVIDESHNFKGNPMDKRTEYGAMKMNRAKWLMEKVIKSGNKTKVLLLSATPVNNSLRDLRNQIYFITEGKDDALKQVQIESINRTLEIAQAKFSKWAEQKNKKTTQDLLNKLDPSFFKLLDELTIARSRKHIINFYDSKSIGTFPQREKPLSISSEIDTQNKFPSYEEINEQILEYRLSLFNPTAYVLPEKKNKYESSSNEVVNFKQSDRERFLIGMMKVNFLKRLESSIQSFKISLERTVQKIESLEAKISEFKSKQLKPSNPETLENFIPSEEEQEEVSEDSEAWLVGKKLKFNLEDLNLDSWLKALKNDKDALVSLLKNAKEVTPERDAKLKKLKEIIEQKVNHPFNKENKKVLVFTAFSDTAKYLYENLKNWVRNNLKLHIALVCGNETQTTLGRNDYNSILLNFSPLSKNRLQLNTNLTKEIDILIATDCISEGQNLQDCDFLINYDIHWNPVRIIQRFGRIDRLGSKNKTVRLVNFWPTKDLDQYIQLQERVECRMALVDVTATGDDNILQIEQIEEQITNELHFRNEQLKKLQNVVIDLEEMNDSISLTDFTLDYFRIELSNFIKNSSKSLKKSPLGLYAIVPAPSGDHASLIQNDTIEQTVKEMIQPGVIFCLAQKNSSQGNQTTNPLNPYFLVYVYNDGTVKYNYTNAKQILEIYKSLCQGVRDPYQELCDLFNENTEHGKKMDAYANLLKKGIEAIKSLFQKKVQTQLTTHRGATLIPIQNQINEMDDFELITWLVII